MNSYFRKPTLENTNGRYQGKEGERASLNQNIARSYSRNGNKGEDSGEDV
jgi:hypothetical protein